VVGIKLTILVFLFKVRDIRAVERLTVGGVYRTGC